MIYFIGIVKNLIFLLGILGIFLLRVSQFSLMYFKHGTTVLLVLKNLLEKSFGYKWVVGVALDRFPEVLLILEDLDQPL